MRLGFTIAGATALFATAAFAQGQDFSKVQIETTDPGNRTYMRRRPISPDRAGPIQHG